MRSGEYLSLTRMSMHAQSMFMNQHTLAYPNHRSMFGVSWAAVMMDRDFAKKFNDAKQ